MRKMIAVLVIIAMAVVGMAGAANYMYEKASVKGVGYKNVEMIISTQTGFEGQKLVEKESGSGNVITERTELEAERQLQRGGLLVGAVLDPGNPEYWMYTYHPELGKFYTMPTSGILTYFPGVDPSYRETICAFPTGGNCPMDYI